MAVVALTDAYAYVGGYDMTSDLNMLEGQFDSESLTTTTFPKTWTTVVGGLKTTTVRASGFWQADSDQVDPAVFDNFGSSQPTLFGFDSSEGAAAYFVQARHVNYQMFGEVGTVAPFAVQASSTDKAGAVRGALALTKTSGLSSTGDIGSGVQLAGGVAAGEYLYAIVNVFAAGTTITIDVESDDNAGFTSATSRGTLGPITATGGAWLARVAGPITDQYYRFNITAVTGSFTAAGAIGVG